MVQLIQFKNLPFVSCNQQIMAGEIFPTKLIQIFFQLFSDFEHN